MRISSIDIGTNTILLLIAETRGDAIVDVVHDEQVIARLGKGVDEHRTINQETFHRAAAFLQSYRETSLKLHAEKIRAVGTSALRDASNKTEFCNFIQEKTGITIEILSGEEEAEWTFRGAVYGNKSSDEMMTVIDIGGGSTEIISGTSSAILHKASLDIGCVRITERLLRSTPPTSIAIDEAKKFIRRQLSSIDLAHISLSKVFGVAGTVTTLAAMDLQLPVYDRKKVHGFVLQYKKILIVFGQLITKTVDEIKAIPQISDGRADIIAAGVLILLEFMETADIDEITVSDQGLRYGVILRELERKKTFH